ncbi:DNA cytosine methyltransferase [Streptomyces globosus]|uniref:DNA cytosine methyltransferase n=1 Tax=Streptomyces globosus TaxID=68209 RepID=UPI0013B426BF|nr:DNA cytosine methyltransferase [Streptomyces globosus]
MPEPIEPCAGQMSFDDEPEPEPAAPEHETTVAELDGHFIPSCSCGWEQDNGGFRCEEFAQMRAGHHRGQPEIDVDRPKPEKATREINGTEFTATWERHQYVIRWHRHALQVGKTAGEAFRRLEAGLRDNPEPYAAEMTEVENKSKGSSSMGRGSMAPKRKAAAVKVSAIAWSDKNTFPCVAELLGHRYVVRKLAGNFSAQHEHSDGARLIFDDQDPKNRCRTGGAMFPNLPAVKRAILADAIQRGEVEEHQDQPERKPVTHADLFAVDGAELVALLDSLTVEQRETLAAPWPVRWLYPAEMPRGLNFCAGCGGGCKGKRLVSDTDMICIDLAGDAVATSEAAGCTVLLADVKTLTPEHPALRFTSETMFTMPCTDWTIAGKGLGRDASNLEILTEAIDQVGFAFGNYEKDGTEYCDHEENGQECTWEEGCFSSYGDRTDMTVPEMWALVDGMTSKTAGLMLAPVIWCLGLRYIGAPLTRVVIEQAAALPEEIKDEICLELNVAGCEQGEWTTLDAADFGSPSNRKRSIMAAHWYRRPGLPQAPGITTLACDAIGWDAEDEINTRGVRKTSGGNAFRMDGVTSRHPEPKPINGITSKIRGWYNAATGRRFTIEEVCLLVGLPADYPVTGSRSSQTQQLGDIFSPLVSLAVWGQLLGVPWRELLRRYLGELYPAVHGADTEENLVDESPAGADQDPALVDTEGNDTDECDHSYAWLTVDTAAEGGRGVAVGCADGCQRLTRKGRSRTSALALAECESCEVTGDWERVSDTVERVAVEWKPKRTTPMAELLEKHVGADWKPLEATADPEFTDVEEEEQPRYQGPLTRQQKRAAWRLAAGESVQDSAPADTEKKPLALEAAPVRLMLEAAPLVLPNTGRAYWEPGQRVTLDHRAGRTRYSHIGKGVRVEWDDAPNVCAYVSPRVLWAEGTEPLLERADERDELLVELLTEELRERPVDPRLEWMRYERPAPVDPRLAWMDYEHPEPEPVDVLAELRAELEELRLDVEEWGAEVAALAVAEAERVVAEVARDMRAAEVLALREEARELRESLGWGPMVWEPVRQQRRGGWGLAASVAGVLAGVGVALGQVVPPRG